MLAKTTTHLLERESVLCRVGPDCWRADQAAGLEGKVNPWPKNASADFAESPCRWILHRIVNIASVVAKRNIANSSWLMQGAAKNPRRKINFLQALALGISGARAFCFSAESTNSVGRWCRARVRSVSRGRNIAATWKEIPVPNLAEHSLRTHGLKLFPAWCESLRFPSSEAA